MSFDLRAAKKIVITGGAGLLGRHVAEELARRGVPPGCIHVPRSHNSDLRIAEEARRAVAGADLVFHLAARVGGIGFNQKFPGMLFFENTIMGINVIEACRLEKVGKIVVAGTVCAYPRHTPLPFREEDLWNGYPEETNATYGIAKKSLLVMLDAYRKQYGLNGIFLLPVNLYGPHDNFNLEQGHVIPAMVRKFVEAKESGVPAVTLWGDGSATREFIYVADVARGLVMAAEHYDSSEPVNLGSGEEFSIRDLARIVREKVSYQGRIEWDKSRPNGQERRRLDVSRAKERFGFIANVKLQEGLGHMLHWWLENRV